MCCAPFQVYPGNLVLVKRRQWRRRTGDLLLQNPPWQWRRSFHYPRAGEYSPPTSWRRWAVLIGGGENKIQQQIAGGIGGEGGEKNQLAVSEESHSTVPLHDEQVPLLGPRAAEDPVAPVPRAVARLFPACFGGRQSKILFPSSALVSAGRTCSKQKGKLF